MSDISQIESEERELTAKLQAAEREVAVLTAQLALLARLKLAGSPANGSNHKNGANAEAAVKSNVERIMDMPAIGVGEAFKQAMRALGTFINVDLGVWVKANYPKLEFSERSFGRPLADMLESGEVVVLRENVGSKHPTVYTLAKGVAETRPKGIPDRSL